MSTVTIQYFFIHRSMPSALFTELTEAINAIEMLTLTTTKPVKLYRIKRIDEKYWITFYGTYPVSQIKED